MENILFAPKQARRGYIAENAKSPTTGKLIDEAIEKENKQLKNILPMNYARPELDKIKLGEVVDIFTNLKLKGKEEQDLLGRAYKYCLTMFDEQEGKRWGEFYTSSCVVKTLVEVIKPY
ncbi:N-6 DNA methylase [Alkalibacter mobilis]|uniref:N-6 DNA methylase n=1 Tax=Alkalibacter mobilis TaxID=2787712 RepID=UPI00189F1FE6|nr:SAM-dependent DNA methyltransferase [Alkalibacter mobilis]